MPTTKARQTAILARRKCSGREELENQAEERTAHPASANRQRPVSEKHLAEQLKFETLLADISARFVNLPSDRIDDEIKDAQRRVCECLDLDMAVLWQLAPNRQRAIVLTHIYRLPGGPPLPEPMDAQGYFPWTLQHLKSGEVLTFSSLEELPPEASRDHEVFHHYGVKSTLAIPIAAGGGPLIGAMSFNTMRRERFWPEALVKRIQLVAQVFINAVARKHVDSELRESEMRLNLAATAAEAGLWAIEMDTGSAWSNEKARELYQFAPDETPTYGGFLSRIHPEDRERVDQIIQQAQQSGTPHQVDYRIVLPDGRIRWINARGQYLPSATGKSERLMGVSIDITARKRMEEQLQARLREIEALKLRLEMENVYLQEEIQLLADHSEIVGHSSAVEQILAQAEQVAVTDATVLLLGETGTGKELLARAIHRMSRRKGRPMITVNCAALPPTLVESELFGREKGAYTGAMTKMIGRFEVADGSTLFLDEIGEISPEIQPKLLRFLEEGSFERLGTTRSLKVDVRVIAATNRDLARDVKEGRFRKDLYYRLNVFSIQIPPLRQRLEDLPQLVWAFIKEYEKKIGTRIDRIPQKDLQAMERYAWPGNIRELKNVIERAMIVSRRGALTLDLPQQTPVETAVPSDLDSVNRRHVLSVLGRTSWRVSGPGGAAEILGLKRTTLQSLMKRLGIQRPAR
jgi:PAS domain S-box-containing protein